MKVQTIQSIDWRLTPVVVGRFVAIEQIDFGKGERPTLVLDSTRGRVRVIYAEGLREVFDQVAPGDALYLAHRGKKNIAGGKSYNLWDARLASLDRDEKLPAEWLADTEEDSAHEQPYTAPPQAGQAPKGPKDPAPF
jgi:hypothetical protein